MATPVYLQIAASLREQIESGDLRPGQQLPTEVELRDRYDASRNTVRDAIKWLTSRGLIETRPGQGTFVVERINPFVTTLSGDPATGSGGDEGTAYLSEVSEQHREPSTSPIQLEVQLAGGEIPALLRIPEGTEVISRRQQRYIDRTPWSLETSFYPMQFALMGAEQLLRAGDIPEGTTRYLAGTLGIRQVGYRDMITVRAPDLTEAEFFKLSSDGRTAVYEILRTAFDQAGTPMRLTVTVLPADRNRFIINIGNVPLP